MFDKPTLFLDYPRKIIVNVLKSGNNRTARVFFYRRSHPLLIVVNSCCYTSVGLGDTDYTVVYVVRVACYTV